jgi:hypothetical protein
MSHSEYYRIKIKGVLGPNWSDHFGGLTITSERGETTLAGELADQAALHGLLNKVRDLGLALLLVKRIEPNNEAQKKER